jgi:5-methylcytosine-specific restriction endonuclease McrA
MDELYALLPGQPDFDEAKYKLGGLCKQGHDFLATGHSLRYIRGGTCVECEKLRRSSPEKQAWGRAWYQKNLEEQRRKARERMAAKRQDPEYKKIANERNRLSTAKARAQQGRVSRTGLLVPPHLTGHKLRSVDLQVFVDAGWELDGLTHTTVSESRDLWFHLKGMKPAPTVADMVAAESENAWSYEKIEFIESGGTEEEWEKEAKRRYYRLKMETDPEYVLYHRQKSKRRKAQMRGSVAIQLTGKQVKARFAEFGNCCAYCGVDLLALPKRERVIEHVVPISKHGPHALGNIVPACKQCNASKHNHDAESWYRQQPFFCERRWKKISRVLGWSRSSVGQLALL